MYALPCGVIGQRWLVASATVATLDQNAASAPAALRGGTPRKLPRSVCDTRSRSVGKLVKISPTLLQAFGEGVYFGQVIPRMEGRAEFRWAWPILVPNLWQLWTREDALIAYTRTDPPFAECATVLCRSHSAVVARAMSEARELALAAQFAQFVPKTDR